MFERIGLPRTIEDLHHWERYTSNYGTWTVKCGRGEREEFSIQAKLLIHNHLPCLQYEAPADEPNPWDSLFLWDAVLTIQDGNQSKVFLPTDLASMSTNSVENKTLIAPYTFFIAVYDSCSPEAVYSIEGRIPGAANWLKKDRSILKTDFSAVKESDFVQIQKMLHIEELGTINLEDIEFKAQLKIGLAAADSLYTNRKIFELESSIRLDFSSAVSPRKAIEIFRIFEELFNFSFLELNYNNVFVSFTEPGQVLPQPYFSTDYYHTGLLYVFDRLSYSKSTRAECPEQPPLFDPAHIPDLSSFIKKWVEEYAHIRDLMENLVAAYNTELNDITRFVTFINTIEAVHSRRAIYQQSEERQRAHKRQVKSLLDSMEPGGFREFVESKIQHRGPTLRQILEEAFKKAGFMDSGKLTHLPYKTSELLVKMVATRNYYVHGGQRSKGDVLSLPDVHMLLIPLSEALIISLTSLLDIPQEALHPRTSLRLWGDKSNEEGDL